MSEIYEGPDALRMFLTGAEAEGLGQYDHAESLGGFRSSARVSCMTVQRLTAFPGIKLRYVDAANGIGLGRLLATGPNTLKWAAPGDDYGSAVTITNGQTKVLRSNNTNMARFIVVERTSALTLQGVENIQIADTYNNAIGMSDCSEAQSAAGVSKYRGFVMKNLGAVDVEEVKIYNYAGLSPVQIGLETTVGGGIQTIADELTEPSGISWYTPFAGSPLSIGTIAPGGSHGVWIRQTIGAGADANPRAIYGFAITFKVHGSSVTHMQLFRGASHIAKAGLEAFLYWWGHGALPDYENDPADEVFPDTAVFTGGRPAPSAPIELAEVLTEGTHYLVERYRNRHGLLSPPLQPIKVYRIASDLTLAGTPPNGPSLVQVRQWGAGGYRVDAQYIPDWEDIGNRATDWLIYATNDGTDPDPETDTPIVQPMNYDPLQFLVGIVPLVHVVYDGSLEDTPIKVLVRTRRDDGVTPVMDSENTDIYSTALEYCGPDRPEGMARYRDGLGVYTPPAESPDDTTVIDAGNGIEFRMKSGQTQFWADGALIWNIKYDSAAATGANGIYTPLGHDAIDIDTAGGSDAVEVLSWTSGDKRIGINVNGTRRMLIDVTNGWIRNNMVSVEEVPSGACQAVPVWGKYSHTCFMVWDPSTLRYVSVAALDAQGRLFSRVGLFTQVPEADCL